jgi:hypothetical protein
MNVVLAVIAVHTIGSSSPPVDVLAMLTRSLSFPQEYCKKLAETAIAKDANFKGKVSFECSNKTYNIDPSKLVLSGLPQIASPEIAAPLLFPPPERVVITVIDSDAHPGPVVFNNFEAFRIGTKMPPEFAMNVCRAQLEWLRNSNKSGRHFNIESKCERRTLP